jgi:hypothetical protein
MVWRHAISWGAIYPFGYLSQTEGAVLTMFGIGEAMHQIFIADWWDYPWISLLEIVVFFLRRWDVIGLNAIDLMIRAQCELHSIVSA